MLALLNVLTYAQINIRLFVVCFIYTGISQDSLVNPIKHISKPYLDIKRAWKYKHLTIVNGSTANWIYAKYIASYRKKFRTSLLIYLI